MLLNLKTIVMNGSVFIVGCFIIAFVVGGTTYKIVKEIRNGEWETNTYIKLVSACLIIVIVVCAGSKYLENRNKKNLEIAQTIEKYGFEYIGSSGEYMENIFDNLSQEIDSVDINERVKFKIGEEVYIGKIRKIYINDHSNSMTLTIGGSIYKYKFEGIDDIDKIIENKNVKELLKAKE